MLNKFLKERTGNIFIQLIRYFVSGGVAFLVDFSLLFILTEKAGLYYLLSTVISFSIGLLITYLLSIRWIFDNRKYKDKRVELLIFILIGITGLLLTSLLMWLFTDKWQVYYLFSKFFTTIIVFLWNFIMKKLILFPKRSNRN
ncbi:MAG: GtrA family protein [Paludibacteraceae bacterium]